MAGLRVLRLLLRLVDVRGYPLEDAVRGNARRARALVRRVRRGGYAAVLPL